LGAADSSNTNSNAYIHTIQDADVDPLAHSHPDEDSNEDPDAHGYTIQDTDMDPLAHSHPDEDSNEDPNPHGYTIQDADMDPLAYGHLVQDTNRDTWTVSNPDPQIGDSPGLRAAGDAPCAISHAHTYCDIHAHTYCNAYAYRLANVHRNTAPSGAGIIRHHATGQQSRLHGQLERGEWR